VAFTGETEVGRVEILRSFPRQSLSHKTKRRFLVGTLV